MYVKLEVAYPIVVLHLPGNPHGTRISKCSRDKLFEAKARFNNNKTRPTYVVASSTRTRVTLMGGQCCHHCTTRALSLKGISFGKGKNLSLNVPVPQQYYSTFLCSIWYSASGKQTEHL